MEDKLNQLKRILDQRTYRNITLTKSMEEKILVSITPSVIKPKTGKSFKFKESLSFITLALLMILTFSNLTTQSGNNEVNNYLSIPFLNKGEQIAKQKKLTSEILRIQQNQNTLTFEMMIKENEDIGFYKRKVEEVLKVYSTLYKGLHPNQKELWEQKNITVYLSRYTPNPPPFFDPNNYILVAHKPVHSNQIEWVTNFHTNEVKK
ncbi:hypothetical protein [Fictibacillus halophilus]|uniref:hypothetical protein n=1 Tax=Fictibacillus halophilus TaxID=1610490 RepID=UPI001CFAA088|nr:hypothetical protein [Fictibacillus halophilus]